MGYPQHTSDWDEGYESVPMISTYSHQSSDSSNSNDTNFCVSPSVIMGSSPGGFNSSGMSSAHHHHYPRHHSESYEMNTSHPVTSSSSHYYPQQNYEQQTQTVRPTNLRPTPISLGWAGNWEIGQFYDLELPTKESKVKEPYLVLLKDFPESSYTPRIVYLDSEANPQKNRHPCQFPGRKCWEKKGSRPIFTRSADLFRHYARLHAQKKECIPCDYSPCTRAKDPFGRKDHYRDHLREFHKEDMCRPSISKKGADKEAWRRERRNSIRWWRCAKCLKRIVISKNGWRCPGCKVECDDERRLARLKEIEEARYEEVEGKMGGASEMQSFGNECGVCGGKGYFDHGRGWEDCSCLYPKDSGTVSSSAAYESSGWDSSSANWQ